MITHVSDLHHRRESVAIRTSSTSGPRSFFVPYFFVAMAAVAFLVTLIGFVSTYRATAIADIKLHWFAHLHGVIMTSWLPLSVFSILRGDATWTMP